MLPHGGVDNESAYRVLVDKNEFNQGPSQPPVQRGNRTKSLLSGGFGRPQIPQAPRTYNPVPNPQNPWYAANAPNQNQQAPSQSLGNNNNNIPPFMNGVGISGPPNNNPTSLAFMNQPPPQFGQTNYRPDGFLNNRYPNGFLNQPRFGEPPNSMFPGLNNPYNNKNWSNPLDKKRHRRHHHRRHRHHKNNDRPWYETDSRKSYTSSSSDSESSVHDPYGKISAVSSSRSSKSRHKTPNNRYGISDSESEYSYSTTSSRKGSSGLNALQKKMVLNTIRDYCPENMQNVVYEDLMGQMDLLEKKGYKLPKGYDKHKHNISENEIKLYEQQLQRDKSRDQKKMYYMINFAAFGLSAFCRFISVDWIKVNHLPSLIRTALEDGEFDDSIEGIGMYLRGSVFDNPLFSTALKFVEKIGQSHHQEMEEEQDRLEKEEERKEIRHAATLNSMNKFRQPNNNHNNNNSSQQQSFDVPPPKTGHTEPKKMT
jgi:hypothetical protein